MAEPTDGAVVAGVDRNDRAERSREGLRERPAAVPGPHLGRHPHRAPRRRRAEGHRELGAVLVAVVLRLDVPRGDDASPAQLARPRRQSKSMGKIQVLGIRCTTRTRLSFASPERPGL